MLFNQFGPRKILDEVVGIGEEILYRLDLLQNISEIEF